MFFRKWKENKEKEIINLIKEVDYLKKELDMIKNNIKLTNKSYIEQEFNRIYENGILPMKRNLSGMCRSGECDEIKLMNGKFYYHSYFQKSYYRQITHSNREISKEEALKIFENYCHQKANSLL